jgi:hypothetical protein
MRIHWMIVALAALMAGGCGGTPIAQPSSDGAQPPAPTSTDTNVAPPNDQVNQPIQSEPATSDENVEQVKAEVGVGEKGRKLDEFKGPIVTPAKAYFSVKERVVFEIQIPQAMNFFQAENGRFPNSDDEFQEKIIAANLIKLPGLPAGQRYVYDPEKSELMVERPRN